MSDDMDTGRLFVETNAVQYLLDIRRKQYQRTVKGDPYNSSYPRRVIDWQPYERLDMSDGRLHLFFTDGHALHSGQITHQETVE